MLACLFLLPVGFEHTECWPFLCPDSWKLAHIKLRSWLHQRADRMAELYHTDAHSCEQNQKKPSQTDFRKHWFWHHQFNALWFVDTHCFWSPVGKFLILSALHNEKLWLLWAQFSFSPFRALKSIQFHRPSSYLCSYQKRHWSSCGMNYLFIYSLQMFLWPGKLWCAGRAFLSLMLPLILQRSRRGFKGHLKSSLLLFDDPFNISLQFCFTKSSLLAVFMLLLFS